MKRAQHWQYWLRKGKLSAVRPRRAALHAFVYLLCMWQVDAACGFRVKIEEGLAARIVVDDHLMLRTHEMRTNNRACTPDSKWAFLTALAVWLQAQYDAHVHLTDNDVAEAVDRLRIEHLQPIE